MSLRSNEPVDGWSGLGLGLGVAAGIGGLALARKLFQAGGIAGRAAMSAGRTVAAKAQVLANDMVDGFKSGGLGNLGSAVRDAAMISDARVTHMGSAASNLGVGYGSTARNIRLARFRDRMANNARTGDKIFYGGSRVPGGSMSTNETSAYGAEMARLRGGGRR